MLLSPIEVRVLGALIEKKHTTPEYYPMSINAITNACNQKNSRDPVVSYSDLMVESCIEQLREKRLAIRVTGAGIKVNKFRELITEHLSLNVAESAVMCLLMLRGAQTSGEIKNRCERIHEFSELKDVEETIQNLSDREDPLVTKVPGTTGRSLKYIHLFYGQPELQQVENVENLEFKPLIEDEVTKLRAEVEALKVEINKIKSELGIE
ncbi:YceH family protein [Ignavibacteriales bacterium]